MVRFRTTFRSCTLKPFFGLSFPIELSMKGTKGDWAHLEPIHPSSRPYSDTWLPRVLCPKGPAPVLGHCERVIYSVLLTDTMMLESTPWPMKWPSSACLHEEQTDLDIWVRVPTSKFQTSFWYRTEQGMRKEMGWGHGVEVYICIFAWGFMNIMGRFGIPTSLFVWFITTSDTEQPSLSDRVRLR